MATHSRILSWRIPWTEEPKGYSPGGHKESDNTDPLNMHVLGAITSPKSVGAEAAGGEQN